MNRNTIVPINDLNRRLVEAGRIRLGVKDSTVKQGRRSIETFRFTSVDKDLLDTLSELYGGTVTEWHDSKASPNDQWQLESHANRIEVLVVPGGLSQHYEQWSGGGIVRRCDGYTVELSTGGEDGPITQDCLCVAQKQRACDLKTRITVLLPQLPFRGAWRLETSGWNAGQEVPGMFALLEQLGQSGRVMPAWLSIDKRTKITNVKGKVTKTHFVVPHLSPQATAGELLSNVAPTPALAAPDPFEPYGELPPERPIAPPSVPDVFADDDTIIDAEVVDDEIPSLDEQIRAVAVAHGLDPERFLIAVYQRTHDPVKLGGMLEQIAQGRTKPVGFRADGLVAWETVK
jgi:hypothetical protein